MSYTIGHIIYGIDLTEDDNWTKHLSKGMRDIFLDADPSEFGLTSAYSGSSSNSPLWLGVGIGQIDECRNFPLETLKRFMEVNADLIDRWNTCLEQADPQILDAITKTYGVRGSLQPRIMLIWGTS